MLKIEYKIINDNIHKFKSLNNAQIHYYFLLGDVSIISDYEIIDINWNWIPLLDFADCLGHILSDLKNGSNKEYFEFTENEATIEFSLEKDELKIKASFLPKNIIKTSLDDFEKAINIFHSKISKYIRESISGEIPSILEEYLAPI